MIIFKRISRHKINIRYTVNGGCIAKIGCAELSFSNPADMLEVMKEYYEDPEGMEKKYNAFAGEDEGVVEEAADAPRPQMDEERDIERRPSTVTGPQTRRVDSTFNNEDVNF